MTAALVASQGRHRPQLVANAVDYDGSTNYLLRNLELTGNADGRQGLLSCWFRLDGADGGTRRFLRNNGGFLDIQRVASNKLQATIFAVGGADFLLFASTTTYTAGAGWHHLAMAWDTNFAAGAKVAQMYVDGADVRDTPTDAAAAFDIDYTRVDWSIGADIAGGNLFHGCLAEVFFAPNQFLDLSVAANLQKFRLLSHQPAYLGADGSTPTGTAPLVYLKGAAASPGTNSGTGGPFTPMGSFSDASDSPSY